VVTHAEYLICSQCRVVPNCSFSPANRRRTHSLMVSTVSSAIIVWTYIGSPAWKMRERKSRAGAKITTMSGRTARQGRHHLWCSPGRRPDMLGFPTFSHARTKGYGHNHLQWRTRIVRRGVSFRLASSLGGDVSWTL